MGDDHKIPLGDGIVVTNVERGDGSTGPFLHTEVENADGDACTVSLSWQEAIRLAAHMLDRATQIRLEAAEIGEIEEQNRLRLVTDHEHEFSGAVWHYVTTDANDQEFWVRLCTVDECSEEEEIVITKEQREQDFIDAWSDGTYDPTKMGG